MRTPSRRFLLRAGMVALVLNEVRGIVTVALTWPLWWPVIKGVMHAAGGR
jgi:hypothetical protein